jgi:hypothetical protein
LSLGPFDCTLRIESPPLFVPGLPWSIQASAFAEAVIAEPQSTGVVIVQLWVAAVPSVFPARSVARTRNWCALRESPVYCLGDSQLEKAPVSSAHSNVAPGSAENSKRAVVSVVSAGGPDPIVVSGAVRSTVQLWLAGLRSTFPARSVARTWKLYGPSARPA